MEQKSKKPLYKKWWFWVIVVCLIGIAGSGLSNDKKPPEPPTTSQQEPPTMSQQEPTTTSQQEPSETEGGPMLVEISISVDGDAGKPKFTVNTNLPDETELMLSLSGGDYMAQTKVTIENGTATSETFSNRGEALSGVFSLDVSMSLPRFQSDSVRSVIGEKGENIFGPYVEKDDIMGENWVNAEAIYEYKS